MLLAQPKRVISLAHPLVSLRGGGGDADEPSGFLCRRYGKATAQHM